jgi:hypothetical protein
VDEGVVVDGDDLGDDVEAAGGHDDVVRFVNRGDLVGNESHVTVHSDAYECFATVPELQRIRNRDDLHDPGLLEALDASPHTSLGESDFVRNGSVRATTVALQVADDLSVD